MPDVRLQLLADASMGGKVGVGMDIYAMKTEYEFIRFLPKPNTVRENVWSCRNIKSDDELGEIAWYPRWAQFCYFPTVQAVYSAGCLRDIQDFIATLEKPKT